MKQLTKGIRITFIHLGFWALYAFLLFLIFNFMIHGGMDKHHELYLTIFTWFLILPAIASYIVYYAIVFQVFVKTNKIGKAVLAALISSLLIALVFTLALEVNIESKLTFERIKSVSLSLYVFEVFLCTVVGSIAFVIRTFHEWFNDQQLKRELTAKNKEMELEIVKAQLNPHFLFNSLNNIDVLIVKAPEKASEYLNKLSELLRYTLNPEGKDKISLTTEVEYIQKYIELQSIRSSNEDLVEWDVKGQIEGYQIPPFMFIPFLENAFKYHQYSNKTAKIKIGILAKEDQIYFSCSNKISEEKMESVSSFQIGNELIRKRLQLLYPDKHSLEISKDSGIYKVSLILE